MVSWKPHQTAQPLLDPSPFFLWGLPWWAHAWNTGPQVQGRGTSTPQERPRAAGSASLIKTTHQPHAAGLDPGLSDQSGRKKHMLLPGFIEGAEESGPG